MDIMYNSFYMDAWWSQYIPNVVLFGLANFTLFFVSFTTDSKLHEEESCRDKLGGILICFIQIFDIYSDYNYYVSFLQYNVWVNYLLFFTLVAPFFIALIINFNKTKWVRRTIIQFLHLNKLRWFRMVYYKAGDDEEEETRTNLYI